MDAEKDDEPQTQKAFNVLRAQYDSTAHFVIDLFQDSLLQRKLQLVVFCLQPLHFEYASNLKLQEQGQTGRLRFMAERAFGKHMHARNQMFRLLTGPEFQHAVGLLPSRRLQLQNNV